MVWGFVMFGFGILNSYNFHQAQKKEHRSRQIKENLYQLHEEIEKEIQKRKIEELYDNTNSRKPSKLNSEESE